jgi:hypothetical protein
MPVSHSDGRYDKPTRVFTELLQVRVNPNWFWFGFLFSIAKRLSEKNNFCLVS